MERRIAITGILSICMNSSAENSTVNLCLTNGYHNKRNYL